MAPGTDSPDLPLRGRRVAGRRRSCLEDELGPLSNRRNIAGSLAGKLVVRTRCAAGGPVIGRCRLAETATTNPADSLGTEKSDKSNSKALSRTMAGFLWN